MTDLDAESISESVEQPSVVEQARKSFTLDFDTYVTPIDIDEDRDENHGEIENAEELEKNGSTNGEVVEVIRDDEPNEVPKVNENETNEKETEQQKEVNQIQKGKVKRKDKKSKGSFFSGMFKFSKKKTSTTDINENGETSQNHDEITVFQDGVITNGLTNDTANGVEQLGSLDSGIESDKTKLDNRVSVEYAVPHKNVNIEQVKDTDEAVKTLKEFAESEIAENSSSIVGQRLAEPIYINGEKEDEDFVFINERAIDVGEMSKSECSIVEAVNAGPSGIDYDQVEKQANGNADDERESNASSDSGTGMGSKVKMVDKPPQPGVVKLKKKSWSFQFGKKKAPENAVENNGKAPGDADGANKEEKRSKWKFGKFSFRKSDEVSASTPDLTILEEPQEDLPTETGKKQERKMSKIRQLITKRRKKSQGTKDEGMDRRSASMLELPTGEHEARKRISKYNI